LIDRRTTVDLPPLTRRPRVTVAVASYNYGQYLRDCVTSALTQDEVDVEVVVVDDGSADDSVAVATDLAASDQRVRVIAHERNRGHIATFNEALWAGEGEFVVKLDSDDMLTPGALGRAARAMAAFPTVGLVYGNPLTFNAAPPPPARTRIRSSTVWRGSDWLALRCRRATNCIMQPEAMVRASVLRRTDGHRKHLPATHDLNLWLRLAALSDVARLNGPDQGYYRVHSGSLLRSRFGDYHSDLAQRLRAFEDFFDTVDPGLLRDSDLSRLRVLNRRKLAEQALAWSCRLLDDGHEDHRSVEDYRAFALEVYPAAEDLMEWRALGRRLYADSDRFRRLRHQFRVPAARAGRSVQAKVQWRRWRRFGT
jgi:glycosyltransferase involved in cell wall biosynthesis